MVYNVCKVKRVNAEMLHFFWFEKLALLRFFACLSLSLFIPIACIVLLCLILYIPLSFVRVSFSYYFASSPIYTDHTYEKQMSRRVNFYLYVYTCVYSCVARFVCASCFEHVFFLNIFFYYFYYVLLFWLVYAHACNEISWNYLAHFIAPSHLHFAAIHSRSRFAVFCRFVDISFTLSISFSL